VKAVSAAVTRRTLENILWAAWRAARPRWPWAKSLIEQTGSLVAPGVIMAPLACRHSLPGIAQLMARNSVFAIICLKRVIHILLAAHIVSGAYLSHLLPRDAVKNCSQAFTIA